MFLAALVLHAAIATPELQAVYCAAVLNEKARILTQLGHSAEREKESVRRLLAYIQARGAPDESERAVLLMKTDAVDATGPTPNAEALARIKSCEVWLR